MENRSIIEKIDLTLARKITLEQAKEYEVLPIYEDGEKAYIATANDGELGREFLNFLLKKKLIFLKRDREELFNLIDVILNYNHENIEEKIFDEAINCKASDIHFEPSKEGLKIRFRINGSLILVRKLTLEQYYKISSRLKIKANMDITEKRKPQDGKLYISSQGREYNCRLSTIPVVYGEKIVLRIMYSEKFLSKVEGLNFTKEQQQILRKIISVKNGLVIINGPTGSGKSTTLYTILNEIKEEDINITTLEDPIEVLVEGINQVSLNPKIGITFAEGLRSILRQDPNIIMVGEVRDEETAKMAVRAAITGHKVYSTIHTKFPREVFFRLEEMGVKEYLIRDALIGIVSQRLIKILCNNCKKDAGYRSIGERRIRIYKKGACTYCNNSGYVGRSLISSVHYIDKNIKRELKNLYEREDLLSNKQMLKNLNNLLYRGDIDYYDYLNIIDGEELNEG